MDLEFYKLPNGKEPVRDFLDSLDNKMAVKMLREMSLPEEFGYELRLPHSEYLEDGIFELRAKTGSDISRVLYFFIMKAKLF